MPLLTTKGQVTIPEPIRREMGWKPGDALTFTIKNGEVEDNLWTKIWRPLGGFLRQRRNERDMLRTLERVKAVVERP